MGRYRSDLRHKDVPTEIFREAEESFKFFYRGHEKLLGDNKAKRGFIDGYVIQWKKSHELTADIDSETDL